MKVDKYMANLSKILMLMLALLIVVLLVGSLNQLKMEPGVKAIISEVEDVKPVPREKMIEEQSSNINPPVWIVYLLFIPLIYSIYRTLNKFEWAPGRGRDWIIFLLFIGLGSIAIGISGLLVIVFGRNEINHSVNSEFRDPKLIFNPIFQNQIPHWLIILVVFFLIIGFLVCIKLVLYYLSKRATTNELAGLMFQEVTMTAEKISSGMHAKESIILCYRNMCRILIDFHGVERSDCSTAKEFAEKLSQLGFKNDHIIQLTRLFEKARYSKVDYSHEDTRQAVLSLKEIAQHYAT